MNQMRGSGMYWSTGRVVKVLLGINVGLFLLQLILAKAGVSAVGLYLTPRAVESGALWQLFTYMFFHDPTVFFHILFNMLVLWMIGSELESVWGSRYFLKYYLLCGVGAGLFYFMVSLIFFRDSANYGIPMLGASGAIYGLLLAYGILFAERTLYFMMLFPMKAKYFVMILGGIELISTVLKPNSSVANAAHLGGLVAGAVVLWSTVYLRKRRRNQGGGFGGSNRDRVSSSKKRHKKASHLKLVVSNDALDRFEKDPDADKDEDSDHKPTWH
jgi:membrane associated rhomboid family serine protease